MAEEKTTRILEIFFRGIKGEDISVRRLADEYGVSTKSVSRDISEIKNFLCEHRELAGHSEFKYSYTDKVYRLYLDEFLSDKELFAIVKIIIGSRGLSKMDVLTIVNKLKAFVVPSDKLKMEELIAKEILHYNEIKHDCKSLTDNIWKLTNNIRNKKQITIHYYKMNRDYVEHKICPLSIMFSEFYFYLIAFKADDDSKTPKYFRIDRIIDIIEHRTSFDDFGRTRFDEGILRERSQFMFPGKLQTIKFWFCGPSVQAVLDKLPTAKITKRENGKFLIEAQVYGDGIKMFLLSQGSWVQVVSPESFKNEIKEEIGKMTDLY